MDTKFRKGDKVVIVGYEKTKTRYGTNSVMKGMFESKTPYNVRECSLTSVKVNNYYWVPDDVLSFDSFLKDLKPEPKIFHYDISNLEV